MSDGNVAQFPNRRPQKFDVIYPTDWQGVEPKPVRWLVKNCIPRGTVCLLSGDSGLGKSLLTQQLQTCAATNKPWLGFDVEPSRSFGFYCEDPYDVLQLRQRQICDHFGVSEGDLEDMSMSARVGLDNNLMDFNQRTNGGRTTPVYDQIVNHVRETGAQLIIIDTLAHTFNGNENIRVQVTAFVAALQRIATEVDGAVVLNSHPSVSSMQSGTGYSGSTAWRATVRAHMYLKRPKGYDDEADGADSDLRVLKTMKANWGPGGGVTRLRWQNGVFVAEAPERNHVSGVVDRLTMDRDLLEAARWIMKRGDRIAAGTTHQKSLPSMAMRLPSCSRYRRGDLLACMDRLLEAGKLVIVEIGPESRRYSFVRPAEMTYSGEMPSE